MPQNYSLPPWLAQPADPAAHYASGVQIGARIGAEQAANMFKQQQLLLEQEKQNYGEELNRAKIGLEVQDAIRKHQAQNAYAQMIAQGVPPEMALMQAGPAMGESANELLRTQAMRQSRNQMMGLSQLRADIAMQNAQTMAQRAEETRRQDIARNQQTDQRMAWQQQLQQKQLIDRQMRTREAARIQLEKGDEWQGLESELRAAKSAVAEADLLMFESRRKAAKDKAEENLKKVQAGVDKRRKELLDTLPTVDLEGIAQPMEPPPAGEGESAPETAAPTTPPPSAGSITNAIKKIRGFTIEPVQ